MLQLVEVHLTCVEERLEPAVLAEHPPQNANQGHRDHALVDVILAHGHYLHALERRTYLLVVRSAHSASLSARTSALRMAQRSATTHPTSVQPSSRFSAAMRPRS